MDAIQLTSNTTKLLGQSLQGTTPTTSKGENQAIELLMLLQIEDKEGFQSFCFGLQMC